MEPEYNRLATVIAQNASSHPKPRYLVAIAGVPGSGKTTVAEAVARRLNSMDAPTKTTVVPMDGFHLTRAALDQFPNPKDAHLRRGAPWTFDVRRLVAFMRQLRLWADSDGPEASGDVMKDLSAPGFDHQRKDPVPNGVVIAAETGVVIIEGNYLLLDEPEWREISTLVDYRVFVRADLQETRERLARRHLQSGIEDTLEDGFRRVDGNDYLNSLLIQETLIEPNMIVLSVGEDCINK